jgi:hypothetical protein
MEAMAAVALFVLSVAVGLVSARLVLNAVLVTMMRAAAHSGLPCDWRPASSRTRHHQQLAKPLDIGRFDHVMIETRST